MTREIPKNPLSAKVAGKSVVYVGPAPILVGRGLGEFVDSFDVVIRSNNGYDMPERLWKDYGKRCDVVFFVNNFLKFNSVNFDLIKERDILVFSKGDILKKPGNKLVKWSRFKSMFYTDGKATFIRGEGKIVSSGLTIAYQALACEPTRLHFTGADFYLNPNETHALTYANAKPLFEIYQSHHGEVENFAFLKEQLLSNPRFTIDGFLREILEKKGVLND